MSKVKVTFANGIEFVYDTDVHSHPTGYGDADGVTHAVVSSVAAPDDAEVGFTDPNAPAPVADAAPVSVV